MEDKFRSLTVRQAIPLINQLVIEASKARNRFEGANIDGLPQISIIDAKGFQRISAKPRYDFRCILDFAEAWDKKLVALLYSSKDAEVQFADKIRFYLI